MFYEITFQIERRDIVPACHVNPSPRGGILFSNLEKQKHHIFLFLKTLTRLKGFGLCLWGPNF